MTSLNVTTKYDDETFKTPVSLILFYEYFKTRSIRNGPDYYMYIFTIETTF